MTTYLLILACIAATGLTLILIIAAVAIGVTIIGELFDW